MDLALFAGLSAGVTAWLYTRAHSPSAALDTQAALLATYGLRARRHFYLDFERYTHLNHGSYGTAPRPVIAAALALSCGVEAFPDDFMRRRALNSFKSVSETVGAFVGAPKGSIALVENATYAVNAVLQSLELKAGDLLVINDSTYNACRLAVEYIARQRGCRVATITLDLPLESEADLVAAFASKLRAVTAGCRAKFVLVDHIASPTALLFPLDQLVPLCKQYADLVMVDGAHAPGMVPINLARLGADW